MRLLSYPATPRWSSAVQPLGSVPCFSLPFRHGFSRRSKKSHSRSPLGVEAVVKRHFRGLRLHSPIAQQRTMKRATSLSGQVVRQSRRRSAVSVCMTLVGLKGKRLSQDYRHNAL